MPGPCGSCAKYNRGSGEEYCRSKCKRIRKLIPSMMAGGKLWTIPQAILEQIPDGNSIPIKDLPHSALDNLRILLRGIPDEESIYWTLRHFFGWSIRDLADLEIKPKAIGTMHTILDKLKSKVKGAKS